MINAGMTMPDDVTVNASQVMQHLLHTLYLEIVLHHAVHQLHTTDGYTHEGRGMRAETCGHAQMML